jgi:hypothetical protein
MAMKCLACGYVMKTNQEIQSAVHKAGWDMADWLKEISGTILGGIVRVLFQPQGAFAGHANSGQRAIPCPQCGQKGRWEDA